MKKVLLFVCLICQYNLLFAQSIGIGTTTPNSNAVLDIASTTKGFLPPLLSQTQRIAISNPAEGLLVYDTTNQRFYQFQNGIWRFIINSEYWSVSTTRNFLFNVADSIGIGTTSPDKKLDVNGEIHASNNVYANKEIQVNGTAQAETMYATGDLSAGSATILGDINGGGALTIDNAAATMQFKSGGINKTYIQLSGDNLRMGTNSGNSTGDMIIRMNGDNVLNIDGESNLTLLKGLFASTEHGKLVIGNKLTRYNSSGNSLPVLYGRVFADGTSASMWPPSGSSERISTGVYEIDLHTAGVSANSVIVVTTAGASLPRICIGRYAGNGKFRVEIFSLAGTHVNNDFYFMINDPMN